MDLNVDASRGGGRRGNVKREKEKKKEREGRRRGEGRCTSRSPVEPV